MLAVIGPAVPREQLAELFWPELDAAASANALRQRLHRLKHSPFSAQLAVGAGTLTWTGESDVEAFRQCCAEANWAGALSLYQGPLLLNVPFPMYQALDAWLEPQRKRLHDDYLHAVWQQKRRHQEQGDLRSLVSMLHRAVQIDADDSEIVAELARTYLTLGDHAAARQVLEGHQAHLETELAESLPPPLDALLTQARSGALELREVLAEPERCWGLPQVFTSFVGREKERHFALRWLTSDDPSHRWLTITGVGGIGKTRLATQLAQAYAQTTQRRVYFFSLASHTSQAQVIVTMLQALGEGAEGELPPLPRLFRVLAQQRLLLVLDNFEHLAQSAEFLPELLAACPQVRLLVTSRERLHFQAEEVLRLGGLEDRDGHDQAGSAAQLFTDRASRADLTFDSAGAQGTIHQIVERCEGVPLAIELAAAWVGEYSPAAILEHLEHSWDFLQTSLRDIPARHRSLRAAFESSWQLLPEPLREAYRRLAVFRAPFSLAAAEALGVTQADLQVLEQRSLLNPSPNRRFGWHENLRAYALERLGDRLAECRQRHLDYFVQVAEMAAPQLRGSAQASHLNELAEVYPDLRQALAYAAEAGQTEAGLRLSGALYWFWYVRGLFEEGLGWLELFLNRAAEAATLRQPVAYALALRAAGGLAKERGQFSEAAGRYAASAQLCAGLGDVAGQAHTAHMQGVLERDLGNYPAAQDSFERAQAFWGQLQDLYGLATTLNDLGILKAYQDQPAEARVFFERSLDLKRQVGDVQGIAYALNNISNVSDDPEEIRTLDQESLRLKQEVGDLQGAAISYFNIGSGFLEEQQLHEAAAHFAESLKLWLKLGKPTQTLPLFSSLSELALESRQAELALAFARVALNTEQFTGVKLRLSEEAKAQARFQHAAAALQSTEVTGPAARWVNDPVSALDAALDFLTSLAPNLS